jgi:hypothetical protein
MPKRKMASRDRTFFRRELFLNTLANFAGKLVSEIDLNQDTFESLGVDEVEFANIIVFRCRRSFILHDLGAPIAEIMAAQRWLAEK